MIGVRRSGLPLSVVNSTLIKTGPFQPVAWNVSPDRNAANQALRLLYPFRAQTDCAETAVPQWHKRLFFVQKFCAAWTGVHAYRMHLLSCIQRAAPEPESCLNIRTTTVENYSINMACKRKKSSFISEVHTVQSRLAPLWRKSIGLAGYDHRKRCRLASNGQNTQLASLLFTESPAGGILRLCGLVGFVVVACVGN